MRILFTFAGGNGHFEPLIPTARAAEAAGHTVAVAGGHGMVKAIEAAGFSAFATGKPNSNPPKRLPSLDIDPEREDRDLRDGFADRLARSRASDILALCQAWQPDVIVCDDVDFGSMIAAERFGIPYASVVVIIAGSFIRRKLVGEALNKVRAEHHLPPDPDMNMLSRYLVLSPVPPRYRDPAYPLPPTGHSIRPTITIPPAGASLPTWMGQMDDKPTVYFTLGTVFHLESGDLFMRVLAGLRDLSINVITTVGREIDPAEFGAQPDHIHIEQFIPQALVLPRCKLVISHGGSGSVVGSLTHGLPSVLMPMGADQPHNARRCEALGVGLTLDAGNATPDVIREAVSDVLENPRYRQAAERMRAEIAALPEPEYAVKLLERLGAEKQPITSV